MFRSCLGIIFGLKMPTFSFIFSSKGRYMTSKIKILGQNLALWEGHFDHFQGQKSRFLGFLKVVLEMFRSCLGIIFGLKMLTFSCIKLVSICSDLLWGPAVALNTRKNRRFLIRIFFLPPYDASNFWLLLWRMVGWMDGRAYLPFGTLDHVRAIFFEFIWL